MKEIAAEHDVGWDPTDTEAELLKSHEDLLVRPMSDPFAPKFQFSSVLVLSFYKRSMYRYILQSAASASSYILGSISFAITLSSHLVSFSLFLC